MKSKSQEALLITRLTEPLEGENVNPSGVSLTVQHTFRLNYMPGLRL